MTIFKKKFNTIFIFIGVFIQSCNIINPAEPIPSYLKINSINLSSSLGSSSAKISDVYVNIDTRYQGAYPLPANFPLLESGEHEMVFFPGIIINGISNTRTAYPLYKPFSKTVTLQSGEITELLPVVEYYENVKCPWCEDFEGAGFSLTKSENSDTGMIHLTNNEPDIFEGGGCGAVFLDDAHIQFKISTSQGYDLPIFGQAVYLELNYKCNQEFIVGVIAEELNTTHEVPVIVVNAKESWNKLYIELGSVIQAYPNASEYKIYLNGIKSSDISNPAFYFDNFKLLHN